MELPDEAATEAFGRRLAGRLRPGDALCLSGGLGAGKTTLARAVIRALTRADEEVPSPTFTLMQSYDGRDFAIAHLDLYRLASAAEVFELGLEEALDTGAAIIEWPERLGSQLPPDRLDVGLTIQGEGRTAVIAPHGSWIGRDLQF